MPRQLYCCQSGISLSLSFCLATFGLFSRVCVCVWQQSCNAQLSSISQATHITMQAKFVVSHFASLHGTQICWLQNLAKQGSMAACQSNSKRAGAIPLSLGHSITTQAKFVLRPGSWTAPAISDEHIWGNFGSLGNGNNGRTPHWARYILCAFRYSTRAQPVWFGFT